MSQTEKSLLDRFSGQRSPSRFRFVIVIVSYSDFFLSIHSALGSGLRFIDAEENACSILTHTLWSIERKSEKLTTLEICY